MVRHAPIGPGGAVVHLPPVLLLQWFSIEFESLVRRADGFHKCADPSFRETVLAALHAPLRNRLPQSCAGGCYPSSFELLGFDAGKPLLPMKPASSETKAKMEEAIAALRRDKILLL